MANTGNFSMSLLTNYKSNQEKFMKYEFTYEQKNKINKYIKMIW